MSSHYRDSKTNVHGSYSEDDPEYTGSRFLPSGAISITEALSKRFVSKSSESTYATLNANDSVQIPLATNYVKARLRATPVRLSATNVPLASSNVEPVSAPYYHGQSTVPKYTQHISSVFPAIPHFTQSSPGRSNRNDSLIMERTSVSELPSPLVPHPPPPVPLRPAQLMPYVPPTASAPAGIYDHVNALGADAASEAADVAVGRYILLDTHCPISANAPTTDEATSEQVFEVSPRPIWPTDAPPGSSALTVAHTHTPPRTGSLFGNLHAFVRRSLAVEQGLPPTNAPAAAAVPVPLTPAQVHAAERAEALAAVSTGVTWERAAVAAAQKLLPHPCAAAAPAVGYFLDLDELRGLRLPAALEGALASGALRAEHLDWRVQLSWFDWRSRSFFGRTSVGATVPVFLELHPRANGALPPLPPHVTAAVSTADTPDTDSASAAPAAVSLGATGLTGATPPSATLLAAAVEGSSAVMPPQGYYYLSPLRDADTLLVVEAVLVVQSVAGAREFSLGWTALAPVPPAPGCASGIALEVASTATTNARVTDFPDQNTASAPLPASTVDVCAAEVMLPSDEPLHADPAQRRALAAVALARPVNQPTVLSFFQGSPRALMLLPEAGPAAQSFTALVQLGALLPAPGLSLAFRMYQCSALQRLQHLLLPHTLYPAHGRCAIGGLPPLKLLLREGPTLGDAATPSSFSASSSASVCLVAGTLPAPRLLPALAAALPAATATLRAPIVAVPRSLEPRLLAALLYQRASFARQRSRPHVGVSALKTISALSGLLASCVPHVHARRLLVGIHNGQRFVHDPVQVPLAASAPAALSSSPFQHYSFDGQLDLFSTLPLAFAPLGPPLALVAYLVYELQWLPLTQTHARAAPPSADAPTSSLVLASLTLPLPRAPIVADARHVHVAADGALLDAHTGHTVVRADGTVPARQRVQPRAEASALPVFASVSFDFLTADGVLLPANTADGFCPLSAPMHRSTGATLIGLPRFGFSSAAELLHPHAHKTIWMHAQLRAPAAYAPLLERRPHANDISAGVAADGAVTLVAPATGATELRGTATTSDAAINPGADTSFTPLPVALSTQTVRVRVQRRRDTAAPIPDAATGKAAAPVQAVRRRRRPADSAAPEEATSPIGALPLESAPASATTAELPSVTPARDTTFPATSSLAALRGRAQLDFSAAAVTKPFSLRRGTSSYFEVVLENPFAHDLVALVTVHDPQYSVHAHAFALRRGDAARSFEPEVSVAADLAAARSYRSQADPAAYAAYIGPRSLTAPTTTRPPLALPRALNGPDADAAGVVVPAVVQRADDHTRCYLLMLAEAQTVAVPFIFHAHPAPPAPLTFAAPTPTPAAVPGWAAARVVTITVSTLRGEPIAQLRLDVQEPLHA